MNLADNLERASRFHARTPALVLGDEVVTYRELDRQSRGVAGFLAVYGVRPGERVALMLPNTLEFAPLYYGILRVGAIVVPLDPHLTDRDVAYYLTDCRPRLLFVWPSSAAACADAARTAAVDVVVVPAGGLASALHAHASRNGHLSTEGPASHEDTAPHEDTASFEDTVPRDPDDTAAILYTSGATGPPKGAELTHGNLVRNAELVAQDLLELSTDDVVLGALPLFHSFGQTAALHAAVRAGSCLALVSRLDASDVLAAVRNHRVTVLPAVPTLYVALLTHPHRDHADTRSLRVGTSGGSALPVEVLLAFERTFGCVVLEGYGLSETSPVAACNRVDRRRVGSVGPPLPGVDLRIVDDRGNDVDAGELGEIAVRGHNVMKGYWNRPAETAAAIPDGWLRTGDVGRRDEDGFVYLVDRTSDLIVRDGRTVYPREIEEVFYEHPAVLEAAVVGAPSGDTTPEIVALVTLRPGQWAGSDELRTYVTGKVAAHQRPTAVHVVDRLPTSPTGKILKHAITF